MTAYSEPVTQDEIRQMRTLERRGFSHDEIAEKLNRNAWTVKRWLRQVNGQSGYIKRGKIIVLEDPTGLFDRGAEFSTLDLTAGLANQTWPAGMRFGVDNNGIYFEATVEYRIVADDGRELIGKRGGSYKWVKTQSF